MFSFRVRVPADIAAAWGRREIIRSLGTRNGGVARLYAARLALSLPKLWKDARRLEETDDAEPLILDWFKDAVASAHYSLRRYPCGEHRSGG